jgi:phage recombination protein Bet
MTSATILRGLQTVKNVLAPDLSDDELKLFAMVAARSGLDPFAKQVYAVKRKGRVTFQTGIDGYRSIAARTGMYDGQDEPEFGPWIEKPFGHPEFCVVRVHRKGVEHPISATAYWDEYKPQDNDFMWQRMPRVMLAKVAEALALRKAFPYDPDAKHGIGADLYTTEEMTQADRGTSAPVVPQPTARERVAMRRKATEDTFAAKAEPVAVTDSGAPVDADGVIEADFTDPEPEQPAGMSREEFVRRLGTIDKKLADVDRAAVARITQGERTKPSELLPADWLALAVEMGLA